jgi:hypothetical protein
MRTEIRDRSGGRSECLDYNAGRDNPLSGRTFMLSYDEERGIV